VINLGRVRVFGLETGRQQGRRPGQRQNAGRRDQGAAFSQETKAKAKGKGNGKRAAAKTSTGLPREPQAFTGRVQQRMERTFGAITLSNMATPPPRLSPFQSFGG